MTNQCCKVCGYNDATTTVRMTYTDTPSCEQCKEWQAYLDWEVSQNHKADNYYRNYGREYHGWHDFDARY